MNTPLRIIVADDEPEIRHFLWRSLTHEGHRVLSLAENGRQLVEECLLHRPDLLITEIELPEMDGLEAIHQVCRVQCVPAIVISRTRRQDVLTRASLEMVYAFLVKPIKMDDLQPAIRMTMQRHLEMSRLRNQLAAQAHRSDRPLLNEIERLANELDGV